MPSFKDHFSVHASGYARYRPRYPDALFAYLAALAPTHEAAWDCGTGNGQAAHGLARHFDRVVATDASSEQITRAVPHPRIAYHVATAEDAPLAPQTADLVTVAQAVHWFDLDGFYAEVRRVLKPGGALAVWTYSLLHVSPTVDAVINRYYRDVVGAYWPPERRLVEDGYRTLPFPFPEAAPPAFDMQQTWSLHDLLGYLGTWSATRRYVDEHAADPVEQIKDALTGAWGNPDADRPVRWPLHLRVGRHV